MDNDGRHDFDFLFGSWLVHNRKLVRLFDGSDEWHEFETSCEARPILGGIGNVDTFKAAAMPPGNEVWEGFTLRLFDPERRVWRIWWASTRPPGRLDPPMTGGFNDRRGEFFGTDLLGGRPIRIRFEWQALGYSAARWEQAFSQDDGATWETNWVMRFTR
jgi:hypothetical protein